MPASRSLIRATRPSGNPILKRNGHRRLLRTSRGPSVLLPNTGELRAGKRSSPAAAPAEGGPESGDGALRPRLQYALGYLGVVAGLATLTDVAGAFFLVAGIFVLPPVQTAIESRLGRPIGVRPTAAATAALFVAGAAAFAVV